MSTDPVSLQDLDIRLRKLEKQPRWHFAAQVLMMPLITAVVGYYFTSRLDQAKGEVQRIEVEQRMLPLLFDTLQVRSFAAQRMINKIVDKELAVELEAMMYDYYAQQIVRDVKLGNVAHAEATLEAAASIGGTESLRLAADTVVQAAVSKSAIARRYERLGVEALLADSVGEALRSFQLAERTVNGFHYAYEISRLLRTKQRAWNSASRKEVLQRIASDYRYGMPADLLTRIEDAARN